MTDEEKELQKQADDFLKNEVKSGRFKELQQYIDRVNIFSVLKTEKTEIRHSNVLSWLINPREKHKLGTVFAEKLLENIDSALCGKAPGFIFKFLSHDLDKIKIYRENDYMDILLVSKESKQVIVIENKTGSGVHGAQLEDYPTTVKRVYREYEHLFLYLDINEKPKEELLVLLRKNDERTFDWEYINYNVVIDALEFVLKQKLMLDGNVKLILNDYLETVRRSLMNIKDKNIIDKCDSIYEQYTELFDFILENKTNKMKEVLNAIKENLKNEADDLGITVFEDFRSTNVQEAASVGVIKFVVNDMDVLSDNANGGVSGKDRHLCVFQIFYEKQSGSLIMRMHTREDKGSKKLTMSKIWEDIKSEYNNGGNAFQVHFKREIEWAGDINIEEDKQALLSKIEEMLMNKDTQEKFNKIKKIIKDNTAQVI